MEISPERLINAELDATKLTDEGYKQDKLRKKPTTKDEKIKEALKLFGPKGFHPEVTE